jgi:hypothetical protein
MAFRPAGARTLTGRTWDLKLTLSHTKVNSNQMSTTFTVNLTGTNTTVVFGSTTTFTKFSWPNSTSQGSGPHPPTFTIPFVNTYLYIPSLGNLCWDWRHKNATSNATMPMDAASGSSHRGTVLSSVGTGCKVGSNTATATIANSTTGPNGYIFQSTLTNATSNQAAIMALGVTPKNQNLGWCTSLELVPATFIYGKTDGSGSWAFQGPVAAAAGAPTTSLYVQYAYSDSGQAAGLGLSNMAGYTTPKLPGASAMSRMWNTPAFNTSNGYETSTTGSLGLRYGLLVGWLQ